MLGGLLGPIGNIVGGLFGGGNGGNNNPPPPPPQPIPQNKTDYMPIILGVGGLLTIVLIFFGMKK